LATPLSTSYFTFVTSDKPKANRANIYYSPTPRNRAPSKHLLGLYWVHLSRPRPP